MRFWTPVHSRRGKQEGGEEEERGKLIAARQEPVCVGEASHDKLYLPVNRVPSSVKTRTMAAIRNSVRPYRRLLTSEAGRV